LLLLILNETDVFESDSIILHEIWSKASMKIIHTSDWHLGQRFFDRDRFDEHEAFLGFLLETIKAHAVDLLIVAGDIFDTANPPREAERIYYQFLTKLAGLERCTAVIVGGNHDSAPHLDAPATVLEALNIHVIGSLPEKIEEAIIHVPSLNDENDPGVWVAAVPYLRDRDVRKAVAGESFDELSARTRAGIQGTYAKMAELVKEKSGGSPVIGTGHLTALGSSVSDSSDSERPIHIGNLGSISGGDFSDAFHYVALGHIHTPQAVGGNENIRYCGSPIPLSFGERNQKKELRLIVTSKEGISHEAIEVPVFRHLKRLTGSPGELEAQIKTMEIDDGTNTPWVELIIKGGFSSPTLSDELRALAAEHGSEVLKVGVDEGRRTSTGMENAEISISEMKPQEVFARRLEEAGDDVDSEELTQCFMSLLEKAEEGEGA